MMSVSCAAQAFRWMECINLSQPDANFNGFVEQKVPIFRDARKL